jgi:hypothetical protein
VIYHNRATTTFNVSGNLYADKGITPITSQPTLALVLGSSAPEIYSTTTDTSGSYSFSVVTDRDLVNAPIMVFVDGSAIDAVSVTRATSSTGDAIESFDLYQDTVIVKEHSSSSIGLADLSFYDATNDSDVLYTASSTLDSLEILNGAEFYLWEGDTFINAASSTYNNLHIATSSSFYDDQGNTTVKGHLLIDGFYQGWGSEWTARSAAEEGLWSSITYGNGLFVAMAFNSNRVMTSPDGITWTARSTAAANSWRDVTYGNGLFVAVADGSTNSVITSPDGITWTAHSATEANSWRSITYGNGLFVAVAQSGTNRVMTSPDGITWTAHSATEANSWRSITYGNGLFVAVAQSGTNRVMTSPDGIAWTARSTAAANSWQDVTYGNGLFVAVTYDGTNRVMTSPDGIAWTARSAAAVNSWREVTYGNGQFVALAGSGTNRVMISPDGITWTAPLTEEGGWTAVTYGNGLFVAVAETGTNRVMTSSFGTTITFSGTSAQSISGTTPQSSYAFGSLHFAGTGTKTIQENIFATNIVIEAGATVVAPAQIELSGDFTNNGTYTTTASDNITLTAADPTLSGTLTGTSALGNLTIDSVGITTLSNNASTSNFTINAGSVIAPTLLSITGNYTNNGTFTASTSEVTFAGTQQQTVTGTLSGTSEFYDLSITNTSGNGTTTQSVIFGAAVTATNTLSMMASTSAQFLAGATSTFTNIDLQGTDTSPVWLRSSTPGTQWYLDIPGSQLNVEYVDVQDANAASSEGGEVAATNSTDSGNNDNWSFEAAAVMAEVWNATDWTLYDTITIDHTTIDEDLTDFPVYVDMSDLSAAFWSTTPAATALVGSDIRITTDAGSPVELARELVSASSTTQAGELHFKADLISSTTDTVFRIYYSGTTTNDYTTTSAYGAQNVWSNDYIGVWHMQQDPSGAGIITDSTSNINNGTSNGTMTTSDVVDGQIGSALDFDGTNDFISLPEGVLSLSGATAEKSISVWGSFDSAISKDHPVVTGRNSADGGSLSSLHVGYSGIFGDNTGYPNHITRSDNETGLGTTLTGTDITDAGFTHLFYTRTSSKFNSVFIDGISSASRTDSLTGATTLNREAIGAERRWIQESEQESNERYADGIIDEVRIASTSRSAAWVSAEYTNQSTTTDFYSINLTAITGSSTITDHDDTQVNNNFSFQNKTNEPLFAFKLIPTSGATTISNVVITLSGANKIDPADFSNIRLYRDHNNNAEYDVTDTQVGGAGLMTLVNRAGSIIFTTDFQSTTTENYIITADWNFPDNGSFLVLNLYQSGVTSSDSIGTQNIFGSVTRIQHNRSNQGGGGGSSAAIGGTAPIGRAVVTGGTTDGGEQIGVNPNFRLPTASAGSWNNESNAYDQVDGTYATDNTSASSTFTNHSFVVPGSNTITGITVKLEVSGTAEGGNIDVELSYDGGTSWTASKTTATLTTTDSVATLGGASDLWGRTWTNGEFSDANFSVRLTGNSSSNTVQVDAIQVRVYHQAGGGSAGGGGPI